MTFKWNRSFSFLIFFWKTFLYILIDLSIDSYYSWIYWCYQLSYINQTSRDVFVHLNGTSHFDLEIFFTWSVIWPKRILTTNFLEIYWVLRTLPFTIIIYQNYLRINLRIFSWIRNSNITLKMKYLSLSSN